VGSEAPQRSRLEIRIEGDTGLITLDPMAGETCQEEFKSSKASKSVLLCGNRPYLARWLSLNRCPFVARSYSRDSSKCANRKQSHAQTNISRIRIGTVNEYSACNGSVENPLGWFVGIALIECAHRTSAGCAFPVKLTRPRFTGVIFIDSRRADSPSGRPTGQNAKGSHPT
jgi:hypothetical protein